MKWILTFDCAMRILRDNISIDLIKNDSLNGYAFEVTFPVKMLDVSILCSDTCCCCCCFFLQAINANSNRIKEPWSGFFSESNVLVFAPRKEGHFLLRKYGILKQKNNNISSRSNTNNKTPEEAKKKTTKREKYFKNDYYYFVRWSVVLSLFIATHALTRSFTRSHLDCFQSRSFDRRKQQ